jgi:O-antigen/teichoic acid export membrane protein
LAVFSYAGPLAVLPFTNRLDVVIMVLVAGRLLMWIAHVVLCVKRYWFLQRRVVVHRHVVLPLLRVGGWMTVSNVVSPLMATLDRFLIGAILPLAAVTYYATPYEAVTKLLVFPSAIVGVLFPAFAESFVRDRARTARLFDFGVRAIIVGLFPCVLILIALPHEILTLWIRRADVATAGAPILQWLAAGVLINSVAFVAFVALQGAGRADITGKLSLYELPIYVASILVLAHVYGLVGVAIAWSFRVTADLVLLTVLVRRHLGFPLLKGRSRALICLGLLLILVGAAALHTTAVRMIYVGLSLAAFLPLAWYQLLNPDERTNLRRLLDQHTGRGSASRRRVA